MDQMELPLGLTEGWPDYYILACLWPRYASAVVTGRKGHEYRRGAFIDGRATAFVYATAPKAAADRGLPSSCVVAVVHLGAPIVGAQAVIRVKEKEEPGSTEMMRRWLDGYRTASAHPILAVRQLVQPLSLAEIRQAIPTFQPPQRYLVLNRNPALLELLKGRSGVFG